MNRYVKKRKQSKTRKYKYIYYRINTDGQKRISSKEYYSHKQKGGRTDSAKQSDKDLEIMKKKVQDIAKAKIDPTNNKIILMKHDKTGAKEAQPVPIFPTVRKVTQADKNILPLIHEHGLDALFQREDDIVVNGKPYITYRVNGNTMKRIKEIAGDEFKTMEYTDRDINNDVYMWKFSSNESRLMRSPGIGIFDPKGSFPNPLNGKKYSKTYKRYADSNWGKKEKDIKPKKGSTGWANLPFYDYINSTLDAIRNNQVILIRAGTGSGKTVLVPKIALHYIDYGRNGERVFVTLPKQIIAQSSAAFAAINLDVQLGKQIGYQYQGSELHAGYVTPNRDRPVAFALTGKSWTPRNSINSNDSTKMLYATDGTLEQVLKQYPTLRKPDGTNLWTVIIIDEVHERNSRIDYIMMKMKFALKVNPTLRLILMSATINPEPYELYFREYSFVDIEVPGTTPKELIDIWITPKDDYITEGIKQIKNILDNEIDENDDEDVSEDELAKMEMIKALYAEYTAEERKDVLKVQEHDPKKREEDVGWINKLDVDIEKVRELEEVQDVELLNKKGAILFIVPTLGGSNLTKAKKVCDELYKFKDDMFLNTKIYCAPLSGKSNDIGKRLATDKNVYKNEAGDLWGKEGPWGRKVVIATPVAESSITVTGLTYVIDSGYQYNVSYDPSYDRMFGSNQRCSKAQANQRWGRVGRTEPGVAIRLYSKNQYENEFPDWPSPDIIKENAVPHVFNMVDYLEHVNNSTEVEEYKYKQIYNYSVIHSLMSGDSSDSLYLTPIKGDLMDTASKTFELYDMIDVDSHNFTLGFYICKEILMALIQEFPTFQFSIEDARLIAESFIFNCTDNAIKMVILTASNKRRNGLQALFDPKFGLQTFPRKKKQQTDEEFKEQCFAIQTKNQEFYNTFEQLWQNEEGAVIGKFKSMKDKISKKMGYKGSKKIINKECDAISLLNIQNAFLKQLKKIRGETKEQKNWGTITGVIPETEKENEQKIKQWAVEHGLNIDVLNADHNHITNVTYSIVFHLRNCLVEVIDIYKKNKNMIDVTSLEKRIINEFIKAGEILSKAENDIDFIEFFLNWYNKGQNKKKYQEFIFEVFNKITDLKEDKFDEYMMGKIESIKEQLGMDYIKNETTWKINDFVLENIIDNGFSLKYKIVQRILEIFNLENNTNPVLRASVLELRKYIATREGGITDQNMTLRNLITYCMYTTIVLKEGIEKNVMEVKDTQTESLDEYDPSKPDESGTIMRLTSGEKDILTKEDKTYQELIADAQRKVDDAKRGCWVVRLWGTVPKGMFKTEINYIKWIQAELDYMSVKDAREARDLKLMRCIFSGYRKNIAQKIPSEKDPVNCLNVYKARYKNCFPTNTITFDILDKNSTSFVDFIPEEGKEEHKNYIIYQTLSGFEVIPGIEVNLANFFTIIPRSWFGYGSGKYLPKDTGCNLIIKE